MDDTIKIKEMKNCSIIAYYYVLVLLNNTINSWKFQYSKVTVLLIVVTHDQLDAQYQSSEILYCQFLQSEVV